MAENDIKYTLELDISNWSRGMDAAIRDLRGFEQALDRSGRAVNDFENELDTAAKLTKDFEDIDIKASVNDSELDAAIDLKNNLDGNVSFNIGVMDADLDTAKRKHEDLGANISTTINVNDSDLRDVERQLEDIRALAAIDVVLTFGAGAAGKVAGVLTGPVGSIIEMDTAMQKLEGTTGRMIPQAEDLIVDLYTNAWGDSRTEIANVIIEASNLGLEMDVLEGAVRNAFFVKDVMGDDASTLEILRAMDTMVKNKLVPDFETAADIIVTGLQNGANRGDDLLDTFNEYGSTFNKMGITGEQALGMINRGLDAGVDNSDRIADLIREFGIRIGELDNEEVNTALDKLKLKEQRQAFLDGRIDADEFFQAVNTALVGIDDPAERSVTAISLFGTLAEDFGTDAVIALTNMNDQLVVVPGTAQKASDTINNNLGTALTGLVRTLQNEVTEALNNTFDIDALIDRAKTAISTFFSELQSGTGVFGSLEIALEMPGLTEKLEAFQRGLTEVFLSLLVGLAAVIDAIDKIPTVDVDSEGIRSVVSALGGEQFKFDLGTSDDMTEFSAAVETAFSRGVDAFDIADSITDKINNMVASGDIESAFSMIDMSTTLIPATSGMIAESLAAELDKAIAAGDPTLAANFARMLGDMGADPEGELRARVEELRAFNDEAELFGGLGFGMETIVADEARLAKFGVVLRDVAEIFSTVGGAEHEGLEPAIDRTRRLSEEIEGMEGADETIGETIIELGELETASTTSFGGFFANIQKAATEIEALNTTADTEFEAMTTSIEGTETAVETFSTVSAEQFGKVGDDFTILTDSIEQDAARIEYRLDQIGIKMAALFGAGQGLSEMQIPGMTGGGGSTTINNNVNQTNTFNNQNGAASAGSGQAAANAIRQP